VIVFVIPSWYPNSVQPLAGVFVREQAEALAEYLPDVKVVVSTWGHEASELSFRRMRNSFRAVKYWFLNRNSKPTIQKGVYQLMTPALLWSPKLPFGGVRRQIAVNCNNLEKAIKKFGRVDIIHAHVSYPGGFIAAQLSEQFNIPFVLTEHMGPFPFDSLKNGREPIPEIYKAFMAAKVTVAVSRSLAKQIISYGYREPSVIGNCVNAKVFKPGPPLGKKFVFFTLCTISHEKGIDLLLEAIARWNPPKEKYEFRIGGGGKLLSYFKEMAKRLQIADRIVWLGTIPPNEAPQLYRDCHVFVMPSRFETFGVVFAEAIASGKPVIATRCGGPEDIVNSANGILVEVENIDALADAMKYMVSNWNSYDPRVIRQDFESRFSRKVVASQLFALYKQVLQGP
jgi:glycosyltransferase involved in cell wall biosynthesis